MLPSTTQVAVINYPIHQVEDEHNSFQNKMRQETKLPRIHFLLKLQVLFNEFKICEQTFGE